MAAFLRWNGNNKIPVQTIQEMDARIDEVTTLVANEPLPVALELHLENGNGMYMVVGTEESHMEYYSSSSRPPVVACHGSGSDDEWVTFTNQGHYSEVPRSSTVHRIVAREAMRRFFQTGERPNNITWE